MVPFAAFAGDDVRALRHGSEVGLAAPARLADLLAAELESCTVLSARWARAADLWDQALASDSFLHATYAPPRKMTLFAQDNQRRVEYDVQAIVLPLPEGRWPAHDLARIGGETYAFTKCDPVRLIDIVREPALGLAQVQPYKSLLDAMAR